MAKNFRTSCDDAMDILKSKGINVVPSNEWEIGKTYLTLGLDSWCYPCVVYTTYLGIESKGEHKGMFIFKSDGITMVLHSEDLYDNTLTNRLALKNACKSVIDKDFKFL